MANENRTDAATPLADRLAARIAREGPLPFDAFMAAALYDPDAGYYARSAARERAGPGGDFATAPTLTPVFGAVLARFALHAWQRLGRPERWLVVEPGGGTGGLLAALVARIEATSPSAASGLHAVLVDVAAAHREHAVARLKETVKTRDWEVRDELPRLDAPALIIANELLDDQPVRLLARRNGGWLERRVGRDAAGRLAFVEVPAVPELVSWAQSFHIAPPDDHVVEVPVGALAWLDQLTAACGSEPVVAVLLDYGENARELLGAPRPHGTLLAYEGHARDRDVLARPGERNLTAHVNWTAIAAAARERNWQVVGYTDQFSFLAGLGGLEEAAHLARAATDEAGAARLAAFKEVLLPQGMGEAVKVLVLARGFEPEAAEWAGLAVSRGLDA